MTKLHDLMERICSFDNLFEAYREARKGKRDRDDVLAFEFNLEENLMALREALLNHTYRVGPYKEFYVRYPKPRLVMALGFRDRVVQWAIHLQINPYSDKRFIDHSYGCRTDKGSLRAAKTLRDWLRIVSRKPDAEEWYVIKGDISKYFYRVDHEIVMDCYGDICNERDFLWLMDTIINNPDVPFGLPEGMSIDDCPREKRLFHVGQPIGNQTSQETANIYLDRFDQWVKHTLRIHYYERCMDDFIALVKGREEANRIMNEMTQWLKTNLALDMSPKARILPATRPVEFVGYMVSPHGLRIRKKTATHIKRASRHISDLYAEGLISYDRAKDALTCYTGMTRTVNGTSLRRWLEDNITLQRKGGMAA